MEVKELIIELGLSAIAAERITGRHLKNVPGIRGLKGPLSEKNFIRRR